MTTGVLELYPQCFPSLSARKDNSNSSEELQDNLADGLANASPVYPSVFHWSPQYGSPLQIKRAGKGDVYAICFNELSPRHAGLLAVVSSGCVSFFHVDEAHALCIPLGGIWAADLTAETSGKSSLSNPYVQETLRSHNHAKNKDPMYEPGEKTKTEGKDKVSEKDKEAPEEFYTGCWALDLGSGDLLFCLAGLLGVIHIFNFSRQRFHQFLMGHGGAINDLKLHPLHPNLLVSASKDESIRVWSIAENFCALIFCGLEGHRDQVIAIDISPLGQYLLSGGCDSKVRIWDLTSGDAHKAIASLLDPPIWRNPGDVVIVQEPMVCSWQMHHNYVDSVQFFGETSILSKSAAAEEESGASIYLWSFKEANSEGPPSTSSAAAAAAAQKKKSRRFILSVHHAFTYPGGSLWYFKFLMSASCRWLAVGDISGVIYIWDLDSPELKAVACSSQLRPHAVRALCFSPSERMIFCGSVDGTIHGVYIPQLPDAKVASLSSREEKERESRPEASQAASPSRGGRGVG